MPGYYVYFLSHDGRVSRRVNIMCKDDGDAMQYAKRVVDGHVVELWQEARKIAEFKPTPSAAALSDRPTNKPSESSC